MTGTIRPSDHDARLAALDPQRSFLVQAPAGSGKTELLTDRILALLSTVERPEEIVAITFTRKAAAEMHARVLGKLARGQGPEPEREHERRSWALARAALARDAEKGWQLLRHPARLSISTIDSFCAGLVRGMPWLSELGGMPGIVEDAGALYLDAARGAVELVDDFEPVRILLEHLDVDTQAACEAIAGMLGHRDQWMPLLAHGEDRGALEAALADAIAEDLALVAGFMPAGWQGSLREPARMAAAVLDETASDHKLAALRDWQDDIAAHASDLPRWQALAHLLLTGTGGLRKTADKRLGFPPKTRHKDDFSAWLESVAGDAGRWSGLLDALRAVPPACFTDAQWRVLSAQLMVLKLAVAQLQLRFAETGEVDFIEIAQRAQRALGSAEDPGELLLKLDASIRHLLVDEFQDTSLSQVRLLSTLTAGWQVGDGRTLFLVGDPMQSIYRFRKAEVGLFIEAAERGVGEIRPQFLRLTDNFRSQADVVAWVNLTFGSLLPPQNNAATGAIRYTESRAFNEALPGPAVHFHIVPGARAEQARDEAERLTVGLVRQAIEERAPGSRHPVAILVRARTHLGQLTRRLAQEGIACRAVDLVPLSRREVVADLAQLARALAHPADRMAWLSVLRAPWCGLTLHSLHALFGHELRAPVPALLEEALRTQSAQQKLPADEYRRLVRAAGILLDGANRSGALPLAAWLESLWLRLGGAGLYPDVRAAEDAESLFLLIERLAPHGGLDPARFEAALEKLYAAPQADEDGQESPAVEIMTMHKAKGLEFDTVILYGLHRIPRSNTAPLVRFEQRGDRVLLGPIKPRAEADADPLSKYLAQRDKRRADYEVDRLLYVAATRARHRLHLVGNVRVEADGQVKPPAASSLLGRLWDAAPDSCKQAPAGFDAGAAGEDAAEPARAAPLRRLADAAVRNLAERAWPAGNPGFALSADRPRGQGGELWLSADPDDAAIGTLAHAWLARIGEDGMARWPAGALRERLPLMQRQLTRAGVPASRAGQAAQAVLDTLIATLDDDRGRWLLGQSGARREWPLIDAAGRVSVIDLALSTEDGWLVVDYKTGRPQRGESAESFADRMRLRHGEQLERYCRYVTALDGRPARAALYFPRAGAWIEFPITSNAASS